MKQKLIQIALGAVGSFIAVLAQYYAGAESHVGVTMVAGSATALGLSEFAQRVFQG